MNRAHIFNSWLSVYPKFYQQLDIGWTEDQLLKMCKTEGSSDKTPFLKSLEEIEVLPRPKFVSASVDEGMVEGRAGFVVATGDHRLVVAQRHEARACEREVLLRGPMEGWGGGQSPCRPL